METQGYQFIRKINGIYWFRHVDTGIVSQFQSVNKCLYNTSHFWALSYRGKRLIPYFGE